MTIQRIILFCICFVFPLSASAEFYRYKDANGVLRFTDNLAEVPDDQKPKVYEESLNKKAPEQERTVPESPENADDAVKKMLRERKALKLAAGEIESKRIGLEQQRSQVDSEKAAEEYNRQLEDLERKEAKNGTRAAIIEKSLTEYYEKRNREQNNEEENLEN